MTLNAFEAPHIRHQENTRVVMANVVLTMLFIYVMALFYYGARAVALAVVSVLTCCIADTLCVLLAGRRPNPRDLSPIITGMILPLLMPASIEYRVVVAAALFAILVAKQPFGGTGHNVFNPAAAGFCFTAICYGERMFSYPLPLTRLPVTGVIETLDGISPAFTLNLGGIPNYDFVEMALGNFPGPMGATNIVVILTCLLYLVSRNTVRWVTPFCYFLATAAFAFLFPRIGIVSDITVEVRVQSVMYEMMSGMLLFGGVFLMGDPVTTPKRTWSKAAFAVAAGIAVMLFRRYGNFEEEFPFAILLMNATVWGFDMLGERVASFIRRRKYANIGRQGLQTQTPNP